MTSSDQVTLQQTAPEHSKFTIECVQCGTQCLDDSLTCTNDSSLLRAKYSARQLHLHNCSGVGRFHDWLPISEPLTTDSGPITYKSTGLAGELGLSNLYIGFNGYWPERDARILTCSFKELEAYPTMQRLGELGKKKLVLASAGNTARAFSHAAIGSDIDLYIVVPGSGLDKMWLPEVPTDNIHYISMANTCDYTDAIQLADRIAALPGMTPEGGARNVARRDGMGTVMLDGTVTMDRMPDHYFQAIGSGTGGIAAWEASLRLQGDGRFGNRLPRLHLSQNMPFAPMFSAWQNRRREIIEDLDMPYPKQQISQMYADVLSNRKPPYSAPGGVFDALSATNGNVYGIRNSEAETSRKLFEAFEAIDIVAPAGVAVASLVKAVEDGNIGNDDHILLNITGGGFKRLKEDYTLCKIKPEAEFNSLDADIDQLFR